MRLLLVFLLACVFLPAETPLPQGRIVDRVACGEAPEFGYAAYVPTSYRPGRPAPVLLGISPVGRGGDPVRLFREAAERHGWILVGSLEARNGPLPAARAALKAVWKDVRKRLDVDVANSAVGGLSGGARFALDFLRMNSELRGLVSMGAFGNGSSSVAGLGKHAAVLLCGETDFNHDELVAGAKELRSRGWTVWADRFSGGHEWPSAELCGEILDYLQLDVMARGVRSDDPSLAVRFAGRRLVEARAAEGLLAQRRWEAIRAQGPNEEADRALKSLAGDRRVARELALERQAESEIQLAHQIRWKKGYAELLHRWLRQAESADPSEAVFAQRLLGNEELMHRMALQEALDRKEWSNAAALGRNLTILRPKDGHACLLLACALAGQGRREEALAALREGEARGFRPKGDPRTFPGLEVLKGDSAAEAIFTALGHPAK